MIRRTRDCDSGRCSKHPHRPSIWEVEEAILLNQPPSLLWNLLPLQGEHLSHHSLLCHLSLDGGHEAKSGGTSDAQSLLHFKWLMFLPWSSKSVPHKPGTSICLLKHNFPKITNKPISLNKLKAS